MNIWNQKQLKNQTEATNAKATTTKTTKEEM